VVLENVIEQMPKWVCKNDGCDFTRVCHEPVTDHKENHCTFRLIECGRCGQQIRLNNLQDHMNIVHERAPGAMKLSQPRKHAIRKKIIKKIQSIYEVTFQHENLVFLANWLEVDTSYMFWLSYIGSKNDAEKYEYTLMIKRTKDRHLEMAKSLLKATTYCVPCDVSHEEMKRRKEAIMISKELVERATEGNEYLHYVLTIGFT